MPVLRRLLVPLACLLLVATPAFARSRPTAARPIVPTPSAGTVSGAVVSVGAGTVTVRTGGRRMGVMAALDAAADAVAAGDYPYVYGGGHAAAGSPSAGLPATSAGLPATSGHGAGHPRGARPVGYDCSGSVAAVLAGAGLWSAGEGVPGDAGVIAQLRSAGLITRGRAASAGGVTLWDDPGVHIFLQLGRRFFGTSDGMGGSPLNPNGGAGWLNDGAPDTHTTAFAPWHLVASALTGSVVYGPTITVGLGALDPGTLHVGRRVALRWRLVAGVPVADVSSAR